MSNAGICPPDPQREPEQALASFAASLRIGQIPAPVLRRAEDLLLDWLACALAGKQAAPVEAITRFAQAMGTAQGRCEILIHRSRSSPLCAAMEITMRPSLAVWKFEMLNIQTLNCGIGVRQVLERKRTLSAESVTSALLTGRS